MKNTKLSKILCPRMGLLSKTLLRTGVLNDKFSKKGQSGGGGGEWWPVELTPIAYITVSSLFLYLTIPRHPLSISSTKQIYLCWLAIFHFLLIPTTSDRPVHQWSHDLSGNQQGDVSISQSTQRSARSQEFYRANTFTTNTTYMTYTGFSLGGWLVGRFLTIDYCFP